MSLPLTVFCFSKIQTGFSFLVPAYLGSPGKRAVKWVQPCKWVYYDRRQHNITSLLQKKTVNDDDIYNKLKTKIHNNKANHTANGAVIAVLFDRHIVTRADSVETA